MRSCFAKDLLNMTNLRELKIFVSFDVGDFKEDPAMNPPVIGNLVIGKLPEYHHFCSNIAYIYLCRSKLDEDPMPTLEKMPNLTVLKLDYDSFNGKKMACSTKHFPKLDSLSITGLSYLEEWNVEEGAMIALRDLEINCCTRLKMLPDGFRFITTLQELRIKSMPVAFKDEVVEGGEGFCKVRHVPSILFQEAMFL
ncbi:hypothetical protein PTKIN_Ptkin14bG0148600 [Pterospermum kingtungense]